MNRITEFSYHRIYHPVKSIFTEYRRITFMTLLVVVEVFSVCLTAVSAFLIYLFYDSGSSSQYKQSTGGSDRTNGGNNWIGLAVVGVSLMTICIIGLRGADLVNLNLLLTFFWGIMVFVGPLILGCVIGFDFYVYLETGFRHSWATTGFSSIRKFTCNPFSSWNSLCAVPYPFPFPFPKPIYNTVNEWCFGSFYNKSAYAEFNITGGNSGICNRIYTEAFNTATSTSKTAILVISIICTITACIIIVALYLCFHILTAPIIYESMNDIINYMLVLPVVGCFVVAWYLWEWQYYTGLPYSWALMTFIALGVILCITLPIGVIGGRKKSRWLLSLYIILLILVGAGLAILGVFGILYSSTVRNLFLGRVSTQTLQNAACIKQLTGCCCCLPTNQTNSGGLTCPEWTNEEILSYLGLDLKIAGVTAFISLLGGLSVAGLVRVSLKNYKSDYI